MTPTLSLDELPPSTGGRYDSDLFDIFSADGVGLGCGTTDEIRGMVADGILAADIRMTLIWSAKVAA